MQLTYGFLRIMWIKKIGNVYVLKKVLLCCQYFLQKVVLKLSNTPEKNFSFLILNLSKIFQK